MKKEVEIIYSTPYKFDMLVVTYYSEGPGRNRLHDVIVNETFPLDVADVCTNHHYRELKEHLFASMRNNSQNYWAERREAAAA